MGQLSNLLPRIMGFIVIIITLALGSTIYTANATIIAWASDPVGGTLASFIGMAAIADFGAVLIILGLLITGGLFALAGVRNRLAGASMKDVFTVVGSVVVVVILLNVFPTILDNVYSLISAATTASDTIGETIFGIIPIIVYIAIIALAIAPTAYTYRKARKGVSGKKAAMAYV